MANATAHTLNTDRSEDRLTSRIQSEMTEQSMATMTVAVLGPNSRTEAKTKASETEMRAAIDGIFTENDPVKKVNAARINH